MESERKAIVIGAGLGGVSAAISLAAAGFRVDVFEKNQHIGGKLNTAETGGFTFDLGPSILTMPHLFEQLFSMCGKRMQDYVSIVPLDPHWRCFFPDGQRKDIGPSMFDDQLSGEYSSETLQQLQGFLAYSKKMYDFTDNGYFGEAADSLPEMVKKTPLLQLLTGSDFLHTLDQGICRNIKDEHLREIIRFFIKYVGSSPYDAPAVLNLLPHIQFEMGLWYVPGGLYNLGRALKKLMDEQGIGIHLGHEVTSIRTEGARAAGIACANGYAATADVVVSDMEFIPAYKELLAVPESDLHEEIRKFEPACSGLALHLGVDRSYKQLAHHNVFFTADSKHFYHQVFHDKVLPDDPSIYLVAPSATDDTVAPAGSSVIKALPHIPHVTDVPPTEKDYRDLRQRVIGKLEAMGLTDLHKHIVCEEMWTPVDIGRAYKSNRGAIYGVVSDKKRNLGFKGPKRSTRAKNLYFVGGSVNPGPGMPMVVLSGQQVKDMVLADLAGK